MCKTTARWAWKVERLLQDKERHHTIHSVAMPHLCKVLQQSWGSLAIKCQVAQRMLCNLAAFPRHIWPSTWENLFSGVCEQQRRRPACTSVQSDQHLCYSLIEKYHILTCYKRNFIFLASLCCWEDWFESRFFRNPEDKFCLVEDHMWVQTLTSVIQTPCVPCSSLVLSKNHTEIAKKMRTCRKFSLCLCINLAIQWYHSILAVLYTLS